MTEDISKNLTFFLTKRAIDRGCDFSLKRRSRSPESEYSPVRSNQMISLCFPLVKLWIYWSPCHVAAILAADSLGDPFPDIE